MEGTRRRSDFQSPPSDNPPEILSATYTPGPPLRITLTFDKPITGGSIAADALSVANVESVVLKNNARTYSGGTSVWFNLHTTAEVSIGLPNMTFPDPTTLYGMNGMQVPGVNGFPVAN